MWQLEGILDMVHTTHFTTTDHMQLLHTAFDFTERTRRRRKILEAREKPTTTINLIA